MPDPSTRAGEIVAAARALIGVPFRLHGRDPASGLDCIGLVVVALERAGCPCAALAPHGYGMRGGRVDAFDAAMIRAGLIATRDRGAGDIVLVRAGPGQMHLMIAVPDGHVHAHAGLGAVVDMPGALPWPELARWRWPDAFR